MKKAFSCAVAFALCAALLLWAGPTQVASAAQGDGVTTYRALLIGNTVYDAGSLRAPAYDVQHMDQLLLQQDFGGRRFDPSNIVTLNNATKLQIIDAIKSGLASQADADDVTYFYYSGHGSYDGTTSYLVGADMAFISIDELKAALDEVPGRKFVILDSCYAGGAAGKSTGAQAPAAGDKLKDNGSGATQKAEAFSADEQRALFQQGLLKPFMKTAGRRALAQSASLASSGYEVLVAASSFQYSFEYQFGRAQPGSVCYGPEFVMNGRDWAGGTGNWSGEFTGMLVAGAGCVSFNSTFPEIKALADVNRDRSVTLDELYRYLRGAVSDSTVQVYPENDPTVVFEHSSADEPDWGSPALSVADNEAPHAPSADAPVSFNLVCSPLWPQQISIERTYLTGDNVYADNEDASVQTVAQESIPDPQPEGSSATLAWDGAKPDGSEAGDGWYFAQLTSGTLKYPPVPFELSRGASNFPADAAPLPLGSTFTASLPNASAKRWYTFTPDEDGLLDLRSLNAAEEQNPEAELYDADGNLLFGSDDVADGDLNFHLLRVLKAGQPYAVCIGLSSGYSADVSVSARFIKPSDNNTLVSVDTSKVSYTLFQPDVSGAWTFKAKSAIDDDSTGITLYDAHFTPVAYGDRSAESYRTLAANLDAGNYYILETPKASAPMQVAAWGPGRQPALNLSSIPALTASGTSAKISHAYDTQYFRFTPATADAYRFYATSPMEGIYAVDSYAFLLDAKGYVLASDDDVNYDAGQKQFDFTARLSAGVTYVLAVRAYVLPGQLSTKNTALDFKVYAQASGKPSKTQAVAQIATSDDSVMALLDDDGNLADGIGAGGPMEGWGESIDDEHDGATGFDFGEGLYMIRRLAPQFLYIPYDAAFTNVWGVGHAYVARDANRGYYAWGESSDEAQFGTVRRLDNIGNGLAKYDISCMAQGLDQNEIYFLDSATGKIYRMDSLGAAPALEPAPDAVYTKIAVSDSALFALDSDGNVYAAGTNRYGECGSGGKAAVSSLTKISLPAPISDIAAGSNHAVALATDGTVYAWGRNDSGGVGTGSTDRTVATPTQISFAGLLQGGESIVGVFAGGDCSAALTNLGRVFAWGANDHGQLGDGSPFSADSPVEVPALSSGALGSARRVVSLTFGPQSAYAVISDGSVYVSGGNDRGQLGFLSGDERTFTPLYEPDLRSANNRLKSLSVSAGKLSPAFSPYIYEYNVIMPKGVALSAVKAAKADATAAMAMDGKQVTSEQVNAGPSAVRMEIDVTAQNGSVQAYVLNFPHSPSSNDFLSEVAVSAGCLLPSLSKSVTGYDVVIPETVHGPVTVTPFLADINSAMLIDNIPGLTNRTVNPSDGESVDMDVRVTAQTGSVRDYTFTISRQPMLSAVSATPSSAGVGMLSPGGTDRLTFNYTLTVPATVRIEVKKGSTWSAILNRAETDPGDKAFVWDGKIGKTMLPPGTYSARITPYYLGVAGTRQTLTLKVLPKPTITLTNLSPTTFRVNGTRTQKASFRWTQLSDVRCEVVTLSGAVVRTLYNSPNAAPGSRTIAWDGRNSAGSFLKTGFYKIKITCGGKTYYKKFRITK